MTSMASFINGVNLDLPVLLIKIRFPHNSFHLFVDLLKTYILLTQWQKSFLIS